MTKLFHLCLTVLWLFIGISVPGLPQEPNAAKDAVQGGHQQATYHGGLVTPPLPKPQFKLIDTSGVSYDFTAATNGYVTLLFFGYAHCTSVCPTQMALLASALRTLPKDVTERVKVVFVSTDPAHDNPRLLRAWLNHFDKRFIGLTGSEAEVRAAQVAAKVPATAGDPAQHAAFVLAYTKDNLGHVIYPAGVTQADWLHDLPLLAKEVWADR
jgi:protein SCO1